MVLPVLYAACKPNGAPLHSATLLEASRQRALPGAVVRPVILKKELFTGFVFMVTLWLLSGVKVDTPRAVSVCPDATVAPPLRVARPVTPSVPPSAVAPEPTEKVLTPVTEV